MARPSKTATATATAPKTRNRKQATAPAALAAAYSPREKELRERYPHQNILAGSWRQAQSPDRPEWKNKVTVEIKCAYVGGCEETRIVATSDLQWRWTCFCGPHAKLMRANHKATEKAKKEVVAKK